MFARWTRCYRDFVKEFKIFNQLSTKSGRSFELNWSDRYPCLNDKTSNTEYDRHYIYHLAWAARILAKIKPEVHVDFSSSIHFCSLISAFIPVKFYDYRPAEIILDNMNSEKADLLSLPFADCSIASLSCMHVVEHIGLGRYGDRLDPVGDMKAISELKRVLSDNGSLLFVVPIGRPRIMFNAHRIYSYEQILEYFAGLKLVEFTLIPDSPTSGGLLRHATKTEADAQEYGCGCFWFSKGK